jgi:hypothetical protein
MEPQYRLCRGGATTRAVYCYYHRLCNARRYLPFWRKTHFTPEGQRWWVEHWNGTEWEEVGEDE